MKIAVIGAGFSGANIYHHLKKDKYEVTVFEKSRGAGGRCSTRYVKDKLIDHGTPFFKVFDDEFKSFCEDKVKQSVLVKKDDTYYPINSINKLCSSLISEDDLLKNTKIVSCEYKDEKWYLKDEHGVGYDHFDKLILTIPAPQILQMDIKLPQEVSKDLNSVKYDSIATLIVYSYTLQNIMNPKLLRDKSFKKVVDNSSKYGYENFSSYVIHLCEDITNKQNFTNKDEVQEFILKKVFEVSGIELENDFHLMPHFWRYAFVTDSIKKDYIYDKELSLGICGDYFNGKDLEGSYLSSKRLYEKEFR